MILAYVNCVERKRKVGVIKMSKFIAALACSLCGGIMFLIMFAITGGTFQSIHAVIILIPACIVYFKVEKALTNSQNQKENERSKKREEDEKRFESGKMTDKERAAYAAKQIGDAELMYSHGDLTLAELELVRKKYTGKSFMVDNMSLETVFAASRKDEVNRAVEQHNKEAEKNIIYSAAIGNAIGGTAGAIVGAVSSAQKYAQEGAALEAEKAKAEQAFQDSFRQN